MTAIEPRGASTAPDAPAPRSEPAPARAAGVELLGSVAGSGYRRPPSLVRRGDGQMLQLTPVLYGVLEAVDGTRDPSAIAAHLREHRNLDVAPEDLAWLIEDRLRPLGVLRHPDGTEPELPRSNPLLGLRWRHVISDPERTQRLARPFTWLFRGPVVAFVLLAFAVSVGWLLFVEGLAGATRDAIYRPGLLLGVIALTGLSAGFHELGHAAAALRGGARPGAMGAGLYLIWPAFYTDVSDSYRLPRRDRLRVDLGGLYFNAIFCVAVVATALAAGSRGLLVLVPLQLLQMLRQLVPIVRFDGYHVLADLTGVPDLFARIRPTLAGLVPWRARPPEAEELKPWARRIVTTWVLAVVPLLVLSLAMLAVAAPRLLATVWDSAGQQAATFAEMWSAARPLNALLALVSMAAVTLPALGIVHLLTRLTARASRRLWSASEGRPARRGALVLGGLGLVLLLARAWWPDGQYEPIQAHERGTVLDGFQTLAVVTPLPDEIGGGEPSAADDDTDAAPAADGTTARLAGTGAGPGGWRTASTLPPAAPDSTDRSRFAFTPPGAPGAGDNQALVVNYEDGSSQLAFAPSLDWSTDGAPVHSTNQAYALASCTDCRSVAVAFQVVLIVGHNSEIAPRNESVAVNHTCSACTTRSLAVQTVLVLDESPDAATMAELERLWARVEAIRSRVGPAPLGELRAELRALQAEIIELLGADVVARDISTDEDDTPAADLDGDGEPADDATDLPEGSTSPDATTTTGAPTTPDHATGDPGGSSSTTSPTSTTSPDAGGEPEAPGDGDEGSGGDGGSTTSSAPPPPTTAPEPDPPPDPEG